MTRVSLEWGKGATDGQPDVLYVGDLARLLNLSESAVRMHVYRDRKRGERKKVLPRPMLIGRKLAWRRQAVDAWLDQKQHRPGD